MKAPIVLAPDLFSWSGVWSLFVDWVLEEVDGAPRLVWIVLHAIVGAGAAVISAMF